eukprot:symbB.v1.2.024497.t1/scaffold2326.1/size131277/1
MIEPTDVTVIVESHRVGMKDSSPADEEPASSEEAIGTNSQAHNEAPSSSTQAESRDEAHEEVMEVAEFRDKGSSLAANWINRIAAARYTCLRQKEGGKEKVQEARCRPGR